MPACLVVDALRSGNLYTGLLGITISAATILGAQFPFEAELDPAAAAPQIVSQVIDIVWFNVVGAGSGELRDEKGAVAAVNTLFKDIPTNNPAAPAE